MIHCVRGTRKKYYVDKPLVPSMWLVQVGTDLIQFEVIVLFCVKCANVFLGPFLQMKVQHLITDLQILKLGKKIAITSLFGEQQHSSFQHNKQIGGRLDKLWRMLFCHLLKFLHQGMDKFTSSTPIHFLVQSSMR
jgi:hypothetical protein